MLPKESPAGLSSLADFKSKRHFTLQLPWPFVISWMAAQPCLHGPCYELHLWFWEIGCPPLFPCSAHSKVKLPGFIFLFGTPGKQAGQAGIQIGGRCVTNPGWLLGFYAVNLLPTQEQSQNFLGTQPRLHLHLLDFILLWKKPAITYSFMLSNCFC